MQVMCGVLIIDDTIDDSNFIRSSTGSFIRLINTCWTTKSFSWITTDLQKSQPIKQKPSDLI